MQWDNSKFAFCKLEQAFGEIELFIRGGGLRWESLVFEIN